MSNPSDVLSLHHLQVAQLYPDKIKRQHPIQAIRDDILMSKFDNNGKLKVKLEKDYQDLRNIVIDLYKYFRFLHENSQDILASYKSNPTITLYHGTSRFHEGTVRYYLPSSWTTSFDNATDWAGYENREGEYQGLCCIVEINFPINSLLGISSLRPNFRLNNNIIPIEYHQEDQILENHGIFIHNQPEFEVILPALDINVNGYSEVNHNNQKYLVVHGTVTIPSEQQALTNLDKLFYSDNSNNNNNNNNNSNNNNNNNNNNNSNNNRKKFKKVPQTNERNKKIKVYGDQMSGQLVDNIEDQVIEYVFGTVGKPEIDSAYIAIFEIINMVQEKYLLKKVQLEEIEVAISSGESIVIIFRDLPYIFQYYLSQSEYEKVNTFIDNMTNRNITKEIVILSGFGSRQTIDKFTLNYDLSPLITDKLMTLPEISTVVWNKIIPINTYVGIEYGKQDPSFVINNKYKILWDLAKSLEGIHQNMFAHGDSSLDNSGIQGKNLAFYDYGSSIDFRTTVDLEYIFKTMRADEGRLIRSINNYLPKNQRVAVPEEDLLGYIIKRARIDLDLNSLAESFDYLEKLEIII